MWERNQRMLGPAWLHRLLGQSSSLHFAFRHLASAALDRCQCQV
jgi:hypothetical protein